MNENCREKSGVSDHNLPDPIADNGRSFKNWNATNACSDADCIFVATNHTGYSRLLAQVSTANPEAWVIDIWNVGGADKIFYQAKEISRGRTGAMSVHLVTGGSGFIGAGLVKELVAAGHEVRVLDDNSRGHPRRLERVAHQIHMVAGDVRDPSAVEAATQGCEVVWHLAYINGTRHFYERPDDVLEVGVKGTLNTIDSALRHGVKRYVFASTSETYNTPTHVPTSESERLMIPDITNPRFSYGEARSPVNS